MYVLVLCMGLLGSEPATPEFYDDIRNVSVTLSAIHHPLPPTIPFANRDFNYTVYGSGILLKKENNVFVLTAQHLFSQRTTNIKCIQNINSTMIHKMKPITSECRILVSDEDNDVAILQVIDYKQKIPKLTLGNKDLSLGTEIYICSSPIGMSGHDIFTTGIVTRYSMWDKLPTIDTTALVTEGSSGSLLTIKDTRIIHGMVIGVSSGPVVSIAIPSKVIRKSLTTNKMMWLFNDDECPSDKELDKLAKEYDNVTTKDTKGSKDSN